MPIIVIILKELFKKRDSFVFARHYATGPVVLHAVRAAARCTLRYTVPFFRFLCLLSLFGIGAASAAPHRAPRADWLTRTRSGPECSTRARSVPRV